MASFVVRSVRATARQSVAAVYNRSYTVLSSTALSNSSSLFVRLRPLVAAASFSYPRSLAPAVSARGFATRQTTSSLNDPNPNWSNRPPKETILLDGCDFEHWLVVMEKPEGDPTRDEIIEGYIKTLAMVVGSEEEARLKIYSVSTRHYFAFGALVSEELSYKLKELPRVRWVLPDSYLDVKNKDYGGEPFINGQAVPYDPKYHEEWVRNNARANERNKRNDRPRNFDRSRNFERRRDIRNQGPSGGVPGGHFEGQPGMAPAPPPNAPNTGMPPNVGGQPNYAGGMQHFEGQPGMAPPPPPNAPNTGMPPNVGGQPNYAGGMQPQNPGNYQPNNMRGPPNNPSGYQYNQGPQNTGRAPYQPTPGPNQQSYAPNMGPSQGYGPNAGGGYPYQNQNIPGRDLPPQPNPGPPPGYAHGQPAPNAGYLPGQNAYPSNTGHGQAPNAPSYATNQNIPGRDH